MTNLLCFGVFYWINGHFSAKFIQKKFRRKIELVPQFLFKLSINLNKASLYGPSKMIRTVFWYFSFLTLFMTSKVKKWPFFEIFAIFKGFTRQKSAEKIKISKTCTDHFLTFLWGCSMLIYWLFWWKMKEEFNFSQNLGQSLAIFSIYRDFPIYPRYRSRLAAQNFAKNRFFLIL